MRSCWLSFEDETSLLAFFFCQSPVDWNHLLKLHASKDAVVQERGSRARFDWLVHLWLLRILEHKKAFTERVELFLALKRVGVSLSGVLVFVISPGVNASTPQGEVEHIIQRVRWHMLGIHSSQHMLSNGSRADKS